MNYIICPVRNGLHLTRDAMKDFLAQDIGDVQVFVINNASTDGTTQWLQTQPVHTIYNNPPKSVAASWNQGLRWVFGQKQACQANLNDPESLKGAPVDIFPGGIYWKGPEHALVVNNDVRLRPDTYRHLVEDGGGFVTAVGTQDPEKIERRKHCSQCGNPFTDRACGPTHAVISADPSAADYPWPNPNAKRDHPDFSCYLIRREVFEKVGPFDEDFEGAYAEDADYHRRMHQAGITAVCLDLPFLHYAAQTIALAGEEEAQRISDQAGRNRALFKKKHGVEVGSPEYYGLFGHGEPIDGPAAT